MTIKELRAVYRNVEPLGDEFEFHMDDRQWMENCYNALHKAITIFNSEAKSIFDHADKRTRRSIRKMYKDMSEGMNATVTQISEIAKDVA
jgi:hypothetical protein